jgi:Flp pilus assembly protein TadG
MAMKRRARGENGTILIAFTLFILVLLGFAALGIEGGRWFMVRAELSKSVDAASLAAARNITNPLATVTPQSLALDYAAENFPVGYLGTPTAGHTGAVQFTAQLIGNDKVQVDGTVSATAILSRVVSSDFNLIPTASRGVAQKKEVEIMLVLDRSWSLNGTPMRDLKTAANKFVSMFAATQDKDKMGMISFATAVSLDRALGTNYVNAMTTAINGMSANDYTNAEDALDRADGTGGFTDQSGYPADRRIQQFLIFFSDGQPTAFRGTFRYRGANYDGVALGEPDNNGDCSTSTFPDPGNLYNPTTGATLTPTTRWTGDGSTTRVRCPGSSNNYTTRWYIFDTMPVPGYSATATCIPTSALGRQFCYIANQLAINHAAELKAKHIKIYTIGLGHVDASFMQTLASNSTMYYYAPTGAQLTALFQQVANEIKLRLVQ